MVAGTVTSASVPGLPAWDVVVGERFIAAVEAPSPDGCTSALAAAASDDRVTVEALVGMVPLGGADAVDSFAIVWWPAREATEVTAVVRGDAVVDLTSPGGTRRFDARGIRPWHLADFGAVVALRVTGVDAPLDRIGESGEPVGHARASVRASAVEWSSTPPSPRRPDASVADADTVLVPRGQHDDDASADTVRTPPRPTSQAGTAPAPPDVPASPPTSRIRTIVAAPAPASPSPDHDLAGPGPRMLGARLRIDSPPSVDGLAELDAPPAVDAPGQLPAASAPLDPMPQRDAAAVAADATPAWDGIESAAPAFRIGDGELHPVTGPVLIGRSPLAPRIPDASGAPPELVAVPSPRAVVSGTHLELRVEGTRLVATDLRSTNGTIVRSASGSRRMRAGESIVVAPGTRLDLGDDTIVQILPAPSAPPE